MRLTQFDIARLSRVSQATVSRVLAGNEGVDAESRERVLSVIKQHNYQPDARARSLRTRRTRLLGLVLKRPHGGLADDPFFAALTAGIIDFLCGRPYHLCVDLVTDDAAQEAVYDEMLRTRRVDGLLLVEPEAHDDRVERLNDDAFPFVIIGNPGVVQVPSVDNDNVLAGEMATQHLLDRGYQRIAYLGGPKGLAVSDDRMAGYIATMRNAERTIEIHHTSFGFETSREVATKVLSHPDRPDSFVVLDDFMAFGVILAARSLGLRIPEDLGIVSFNASSICQLMNGGLSSISLNMNQLVRLAVSKLLRVIEGDSEEPLREIVPCELQARGSSAGPSPSN
jgi:DNA-binding LacI/PurR family transcriptional regulator